MIERSDSVYLTPGLVRCAALGPCADQGTCGRRLATVPKGTGLEDYSFNRKAGDACSWYAMAVYRRPAPEPVAKEVKPWPVA